jgi:hypothetical protein
MRDRIDESITPAKERAQHPTYEANQDRSPKSAPETVHVEAMHKLVDQEQHETVHDKDEKAEGENNQWGREKQQDRTQERVQNSQKQRSTDQRGRAIVSNATDERRRDHDGHGRDCPSENEMSHPKVVGI